MSERLHQEAENRSRVELTNKQQQQGNFIARCSVVILLLLLVTNLYDWLKELKFWGENVLKLKLNVSSYTKNAHIPNSKICPEEHNGTRKYSLGIE